MGTKKLLGDLGKGRLSLYSSQVFNPAGAYPNFHNMKQLRALLLPLGWGIQWKVTPKYFIRHPWQFASTHLYSWVEEGTLRACFSLEHNTMTWPVLEPRAINLECSGLTIRPQHLPLGEPWVTFYTLAPSAAPFATPNYIRSCSISYVACKNSPSYYSLLQLSISILHVHLRTRWLNDNFFASFWYCLFVTLLLQQWSFLRSQISPPAQLSWKCRLHILCVIQKKTTRFRFSKYYPHHCLSDVLSISHNLPFVYLHYVKFVKNYSVTVKYLH